MSKQLITGLVTVALMAGAGTIQAWGFSTSKFTSTSQLTTGSWVKIAVADDGIYQITAEQLAEMGFSDPAQVRVYGQGGHALSEYMDGNHVDDLAPVPTMLCADKLVFYAQGTVARQMIGYTTSMPYYTRTRNAYANYGYYFLTESATANAIAEQTAGTDGTTLVSTSYDMFLHESEQVSVGYTGKQLLGESLLPNGYSIDYCLPQRSDSSITVRVGAAAYVSSAGYIKASVTSDGVTTSIPYTTTESKIRAVAASSDPQRHFNLAYPTRSVDLGNANETGQLDVSLYSTSGTFTMGRLDYVAITYKRYNSYDTVHPYFNMGYPLLAATTRVVMPATDEQTVVWDVTDPQNQMQMALSPAVDEMGDTIGMAFTPGARTAPSEFIAFNPQGELKSIASYEAVQNQNLHGLRTPDMLIVTNPYFMPQAERLAQLHRDNDGMTVHVIDQDLIFNEFSSGTPDAMAIRLMCKMLYDRNNSKFKYLLMFGPASYDYRGISSNKPNRVITFETDDSDSDDYSYGTDDFFGILDDNTGNNLVSEKLRLGVGRLTPHNLEQAEQNVDKIMHYVLNPDYGVWRNHYTIWADDRDSDLHALQAEGVGDDIQDLLKIPMVNDKAYVAMFPLEGTTASIAKRHVEESLNAGQFYGTYTGHANTNYFTFYRMWTVADVKSHSYKHQPIFMTACCDVARFDGNSQGIAELMFHQPDGGAIALLTSSREVEALQNDNLNHAFTESIFSYNSTGKMTTLGEAYMKAKQSSRVQANINKMSYLLIGDPAMKVEYPKPLFSITSINGAALDSAATAAPLQQVTVEADVMRPGMTQVDTTFTGDATLSVYDVKKLYKTATFSSSQFTLTGDLYYPRDLLVEVQGRVENGHFSGSAVLPRYFKAQPGDTLAVHVYAHKDNSSDMVNGMTTQLLALAYNDSLAVADDAAPVIEAMYLNDEGDFANGVAVPANSTLFVRATDDVAFNNQSMGVANTLKLTLDGGATTYTLVRNFATVSDGGKALFVNFPVNDLAVGQHTLTFYLEDACGNGTERTISFVVAGESELTLKTEDLVAVEEAVIDLDETTMSTMPAITLKAVDAKGNLVWTTTTSSLPCTWDLTDGQGQRVPAGLYKLFGQFNDGVNYGGTNISSVIVVDPVNRAE